MGRCEQFVKKEKGMLVFLQPLWYNGRKAYPADDGLGKQTVPWV